MLAGATRKAQTETSRCRHDRAGLLGLREHEGAAHIALGRGRRVLASLSLRVASACVQPSSSRRGNLRAKNAPAGEQSVEESIVDLRESRVEAGASADCSRAKIS
eukprot:2560283-Rhodomonas_salina.1